VHALLVRSPSGPRHLVGLDRKLFDVTAPEAGIILYLNALPTIVKGGTVASIGVSGKAP